MAQLLKLLILIPLVFYAIAVVVMFVAQRSFIYFPDPARTAPRAAGLPSVVERTIATPDGEKLVAWYGRAKEGQPTLLYFHGNGGSLKDRAERIASYLALGRGVFMLSYRGYSGSTGFPSEEAHVADAKLAYDALVNEGVAPRDIILYGESLGTNPAIEVAVENPVAGVILDSPFTSIVERAAQLYPWLPVALLLRDRYNSLSRIDNVHVPIFILHGEADTVVPVEMGRRLFEAANEPKEIKTIPGAGHADHWNFGSFEIINDWIDRLRLGRLRDSDFDRAHE
jgi:fermentation-respiration switch protein FrsA (DUF1100 family)